ncbi:hypothetical protein JCM11641_000287 [Rhodosporidiobolus odoratus]
MPKKSCSNAQEAPISDIDDPTDFHSATLRALDHSLRCTICNDLFSSPVLLTNCSHTFDSLCLREHLSKTKTCPECRLETNEDRIRPVHVLEEVVRGWKAARSDVLTLQTAASIAKPSALHPSRSSSPTPAAGPSRPSCPSSYTKLSTQSHSDGKGKRKASPAPKVKSEPLEELNLVDDEDSDIEVQSPPRKKTRTGLRAGSPNGASGTRSAKGKGKTKAPDLTDPNLVVTCPACQSNIKNSHLIAHLDSGCKIGKLSAMGTGASEGASKHAWGKLLSSGSGKKGTPSSESDAEHDMDTTMPLPLKDYAYKGVKDLSKMLKDYRLATTFPSSATTNEARTDILRRRHRQFTTLWNANADVARESPAHKSAKEIRADLDKWERTQEREAREKEKKGGGIHVGDREYQRIHAEQFRELTAQARASAMKMRRKQRDAQMTEPLKEDPKGETEEQDDAATAQEDPRDPTPTLRDTTDVDADMVDAEPPQPASPQPRKRSVRIVSPQRSSPPPVLASSSPLHTAPPSPSRPLSSPPLTREGSHAAEKQEKGKGKERDGDRASSPFDPEPPRPSQRNRQEERMFAELEAARLAARGENGDIVEEDEEER